MKKITKLTTAVALFLFASFLSVNELKAQGNSQPHSCNSTGTIISLNSGTPNTLNSTSVLSSGSNTNQTQNSNSGVITGLILDDATGMVYQFKYVGLEVLQVNCQYTYIMQITANGKIIIRDIHHSNYSN